MARDLPPELEDAIAEPVVRPFMAIHINLPDPVSVFTGVGTMYFDGKEWIGAGGIGAIDTIGEATDGSAIGVRATLYQVPSEFRDDVAAQAVKGVLLELWVGAFDENFQEVTAVKKIWTGRLDTYKIVDGGETLSVEVTGESRARDQTRPAIKRFTDEYQQRRHPGDFFFQFVSQMTEIPILWAKAEQQLSGGASSGAGGNMRDMAGGAYIQ